MLTGCEIDLVVTNKDSGTIFQFDKDGGVVTPSRPKCHQVSKKLKKSEACTPETFVDDSTQTPAVQSKPTQCDVETQTTTTVKAPSMISTPDKRIRCRVCNDVTEALWLGCTSRGCHYWVHAQCIGIIVAKDDSKRLTGIRFYCPSHIKGKY